MALDLIFRLVLYSHEDVSFNSSICLIVLEDMKQFYLLMWFKKTWLETPFKGDGVRALVKTSNCENLVFYFSEKVKKIAVFAMLFFGFQWPNNRFKMVLASPNDQKYSHYPLALKFNVTLARPLRLVILYFLKCKLLSDNRHLYLHNSKWNLRYGVDGLTRQNNC